MCPTFQNNLHLDRRIPTRIQYLSTFDLANRAHTPPSPAAEKGLHSTRPAPARQDAPSPDLRSRLDKILTGDPATSLTRRRAQTWCSLFVAPCAPEGTPQISTRLRPCWTNFLSVLLDCSSVVHAYGLQALRVPRSLFRTS